MSGPAKFWSVLCLVLLGGAALLYQARGSRLPRGAEDVAQPVVAATPAPSAAPAMRPTPSAPEGVSPIQRKMGAWAFVYRENAAPILALVKEFEASAKPGRATCNALIAAAYGAKSELPPSPDPDVDEAVRSALDQFSSAGTFCLQEKAGMQDTFLLLGRAGIGLAEGMLAERYGQPGVPGLAEPMEGGTAIGDRAVAFAKEQRRN